ncbi:delta-latroinsectotoxin-Lt1a [Hydra vulgaris]|uniref:delta-latroinsectotoxin-Lt1a n=1 Tax=Hydra vulgaris TaxID=6087 RepID=UPI001F5FF1B3|nr:delta-latroinsectotoxin-Lt1a-like [Hydra vulgaris]
MSNHNYEIDQLVYAAYNGDYDLVYDALLTGVSPNSCDSRGHYLLHAAVAGSQVTICNLLVTSWHAWINVTCKGGNTPLHVASDVAVIEQLYRKGALINYLNDEGRTPLMTAIKRKNYEVIKKLIQLGSNINAADKQGMTALHFAASILDIEPNFIQILLNSGASLNAVTKEGYTPLFLACMNGNINIVRLLCTDHNINKIDFIGHSPICIFLKNSPYEVNNKEEVINFLEMFISRGCNLKHKTNDGKSLLMLFIEGLSNSDEIIEDSNLCEIYLKNDVEMIKNVINLINDGENINFADEKGETVLHKLAWIGSIPIDIIEQILILGAKPQIVDKLNISPLHLAASADNVDVAKTFIKYGANINAKDIYGSTVLHYAAYSQSFNIIEYLIEAGALENELNNNEQTFYETLQQNDKCELFDTYLKLKENAPLTEVVNADNQISRSLIVSSEEDIKPEYFVQHNKKNDILEKIIFQNNVGSMFLNEAEKEVYDTIQSFMLKLCNFVSKEDAFLTCIPTISGSVSENTKCGLPNEFDYLLIFESLGEVCEVVETSSSGLIHMRFKSEKKYFDNKTSFKYFFRSDNFISIETLEKSLTSVLTNVLGKPDLYKDSTANLYNLSANYLCKSGASFNILLRYTGRYHKNLQVNIDVVPVIPIRQLISGLKNLSFLLDDKKKMPKLMVSFKNALWIGRKYGGALRISFSLLETNIFNRIPSNARIGYTLCKALILHENFPNFLFKNNNFPIIHQTNITSYILKNTLFYELKFLYESRNVDLNSINIVEWTVRIFKRLYVSLAQDNVKSFFLPKVSLLKEKYSNFYDSNYEKLDASFEDDLTIVSSGKITSDYDGSQNVIDMMVIKTVLLLIGTNQSTNFFYHDQNDRVI